jgi:hypothetical protein
MAFHSTRRASVGFTIVRLRTPTSPHINSSPSLHLSTLSDTPNNLNSQPPMSNTESSGMPTATPNFTTRNRQTALSPDGGAADTRTMSNNMSAKGLSYEEEGTKDPSSVFEGDTDGMVNDLTSRRRSQILSSTCLQMDHRQRVLHKEIHRRARNGRLGRVPSKSLGLTTKLSTATARTCRHTLRLTRHRLE